VSRPETRRRQVAVGPFHVSDASSSVLVRDVVALTSAEQRPTLVYALHVGGLNSRRDRDFVAAMDRADVVYADGGSVVWLARLAGAISIERAPTTDVGWDILRGLAEALGRPVRVALVGGPAGLAERAAAVLQQDEPVQVVHTEHGYHSDWTAPLAALRDSAPDACLVGLGAPAEMVWCDRHRDELPTGLVLTCGGWFGHLVGDERRAPRLLRRSGLEWIARLAQAPGRLGPRYARGLVSTAALAVRVLLGGRPRSRAV
jgi:N-acetylglucosaminyldiphosphoundecaprenol N-acetyl-beta-D-mannosaminyltransferase